MRVGQNCAILSFHCVFKTIRGTRISAGKPNCANIHKIITVLPPPQKRVSKIDGVVSFRRAVNPSVAICFCCGVSIVLNSCGFPLTRAHSYRLPIVNGKYKRGSSTRKRCNCGRVRRAINFRRSSRLPVSLKCTILAI